MRDQHISMRDILFYEVTASWWSSSVSIGWMQNIASAYFAWKVKRKWNRYYMSYERARRITLGAGLEEPLTK